MAKLTKNELKVYNIISRRGETEQPTIIEEFSGEYKNQPSKRSCVSIALKGLLKKKMVIRTNKIKTSSGIPKNSWKAV